MNTSNAQSINPLHVCPNGCKRRIYYCYFCECIRRKEHQEPEWIYTTWCEDCQNITTFPATEAILQRWEPPQLNCVRQGCNICRDQNDQVKPEYEKEARKRDDRAQRETKERVERASERFEQLLAEAGQSPAEN